MQPTGVQNVKKGSTAVHAVQMVDGRTRLKGYLICAATNGTGTGYVKLYNGTSASGSPLFETNMGVYGNYQEENFVSIPGNGILFDSGIFLSKEYTGPINLVLSVSIIFQGGAAA